MVNTDIFQSFLKNILRGAREEQEKQWKAERKKEIQEYPVGTVIKDSWPILLILNRNKPIKVQRENWKILNPKDKHLTNKEIDRRMKECREEGRVDENWITFEERIMGHEIPTKCTPVKKFGIIESNMKLPTHLMKGFNDGAFGINNATEKEIQEFMRAESIEDLSPDTLNKCFVFDFGDE